MVGESEVIKVRDLTVPGTYPRTLHAVDDVVWIIDAEEPYLEPVLATLPASSGGRAPARSWGRDHWLLPGAMRPGTIPLSGMR